jgi:hypothetical protein
MKTFIAVSSVIHQNKLISLHLSNGLALSNDNGLTSIEAIEFLFYNLHNERIHKSNIVFVCYAFSRDNEFIFAGLPDSVKDKLFQSMPIKNQKETLELENDALTQEFYQADTDSDKRQQLDFERYVNNLNLKELETVVYQGYSLTLANGKFLTIRKDKKSITIYDIFKFFNKPLYDTCYTWLQKNYALLNKENRFNIGALFNTEIEYLKAVADLETGAIVELATKLNTELVNNGFTLSRFHGASALASKIQSVAGAKKEYNSYPKEWQTSRECYKASKQSFHGARIEQLKIGTLPNVNVFDINSAYAYACLFLPKMLRKPIFTTDYNSQVFSFWFCEYDFTAVNPYVGLLPNRNNRYNFIQYKLKGKGYFYQPEIEFLLEHYPDCIKITKGFYIPFEPAEWTKEIVAVYELRKVLKKQNNPLEKVLKLALASIYGKFCQHQGNAYYYNLYYAGFITSKIRAMLLQAIWQNEKDTICFLTDAIHTTTTLPVPVSDEIGEYSLKEYEQGTYFNAGVYCLTDRAGNRKLAHQGFNQFDFDKALAEIKERKTFTALQEMFTGWNVFSEKKFGLHHYLQYYKQNKKTNPFETYARLFDRLDVDLSESYIDSQIVKVYGGKESGLYKERKLNKESNFALDSIRAKRI